MAAAALHDHSDRQLVQRALVGQGEAAFQAIVHRHGPMVYRVCWRVLQHRHDAEDAFQATFLVLAEKLRAVRKHSSLASWLHGVARRVALKSRAQAAARRRREHEVAPLDALSPDEVTWGEMRLALDSELARLPDKWRLPLILCYLEGRTHDESASQLGWSKSTFRRRLDEARTALGGRLNRRGVVWPAALSAVLLSECVASATPGLVDSTVEAVARFTAGKTVATAASAQVAALTEGMLKAMLLTKLKTVMSTLIVVFGLAALGGGLYSHHAVAQQGPADRSTAVARKGQKQPPESLKDDKEPAVQRGQSAKPAPDQKDGEKKENGETDQPDKERASLPQGKAPVQALISLKQGKLIVRTSGVDSVKAVSKVIDGQNVTSYVIKEKVTTQDYEIKDVKVFDVKGHPIDVRSLADLLKREIVALVATDGQKIDGQNVDPLHLRLFKEGTLLFLLPLPPYPESTYPVPTMPLEPGAPLPVRPKSE